MRTLVFLPALFALFAIFTTGPADAATVPRPLSPLVSDYADVIDGDYEARIAVELGKLRSDKDIEFAVVTISALKDYDASSIESYATELFNDWGIGNAERNDGVLLLIAVDDHKMRIELGRGYPGRADGEAAAIIADTLRPAFRGGDIPGGIENGVAAIVARIVPLAGTPAASAGTDTQDDTQDTGGKGNGFGLGFAVLGVALLAVFWKIAKGQGWIGRSECPECHQRAVVKRRETVTKPTSRREGKRKVTATCRKCGYNWVDYLVLPVIAESASADSGSDFGGGSSDGGGASGDW